MEVNRRQVLVGMGAVAGTAVIGCGGGNGGSADGAPGADATATPDAAPPGSDAAPDAAAANACTATSTMTPAELLAQIDTIVVLCMENRSFDHYLGALRLIEGRTDLDGLTGGETNPTVDGTLVPIHQLDTYTPADPPHGWDACHNQWDGGANDGFVTEHAGDSEADVMGYYVRDQIPITYALADAAAICQRWFCGCLGPTWPNRFFLHGATSNGTTTNLPAIGFRSVFDQLAEAGVDAINYYSDVAWATGGYFKLTGLATIEQFFESAMAGTLPPFSIVDPSFFGGGANDDHPDHDVRLGQALIASVVNAIAASPQWNRCLFVLTYDEHGGFFDHVPPPAATDDNPEFAQLGFRVPTLVLGGAVRRGCAIDTQLEHGSIAKTVAVKWGLEPLTARAAAANDLSACIDPTRFDDPLPPPVLPPVPVSRRALADRQARDRTAGKVAHEELAAAVDAMDLPPGLDRRADADAIARRVLAWGERLGAVTFTD